MTGFDARGDRYGLYVQFDKEVDETNINWTIEPLTLLTKIGGIIGVGKELFWVLVFLLTHFFAIIGKFQYYSF